MNTRDFKTRTIFETRPAPYKRDRWVVGLDIGYSGIKGYATNKVFCFPAYARKVPNNQPSRIKRCRKNGHTISGRNRDLDNRGMFLFSLSL